MAFSGSVKRSCTVHNWIMRDKLLNGLNTLLMWNLFFVLFSFGWLAIAVIGRSLDVPLGLDVWLKLWQPVFNPSIGILMAGALISGLVSWVNRRFAKDPSSAQN
jgi:hypothetical protein